MRGRWKGEPWIERGGETWRWRGRRGWRLWRYAHFLPFTNYRDFNFLLTHIAALRIISRPLAKFDGSVGLHTHTHKTVGRLRPGVGINTLMRVPRIPQLCFCAKQ